MSHSLLRRLQAAHAFDPSPLRHELGVYHVPFDGLAPGTSPEHSLADAARRGEGVAIVGGSGCGKSSLIQHVLGPTAPAVAPIPVPVAGEPADTVANVRSVAGLIIQTLVDNHVELDDLERSEALRSASPNRVVPSTTRTTGLTVTGGWMGARLQAEVRRQALPDVHLPRTAQATLEVVHQLLSAIHADDLMPVLVFDDTDRWLRTVGGSVSYRDTALAFFGTVVVELRQLPAGMVVAVHTNYLEDSQLAAHIRSSVGLRVDVPHPLTADAVGKVIHSRVTAHTFPDSPATAPSLDEVITPVAVDRLHELYRNGHLGSLRDVIRIVHVAVTDACNGGFDAVTPELVEQAAATW